MVFIILAARWVVGSLLVRGGIGKLAMDTQMRRDAVARYALLPAMAVPAAALVLAGAELGFGSLLVAGVEPRPMAVMSSALLLAFSAAITVNLLRGRRFDCGCGGGINRVISWRLVGQDLALGLAALLIASQPGQALALWPGYGAAHTLIASSRTLPVPMLVMLASIIASTAQRAWRSGVLPGLSPRRHGFVR